MLINKHKGNGQYPGDGKFWLVTNPSTVYILTTRSKGTAKTNGSTAQNPFLYWPEYNVAGLASDIINEFAKIGISVDYNRLIESAFNPLNPVHYEAIKEATAGQRKTGVRTKSSNSTYAFIRNICSSNSKPKRR